MRPGETRQSDTRQKHGHRFNSNMPKKLRFKSMKGSKSCSRILVFDEKSKSLQSSTPAKILRFEKHSRMYCIFLCLLKKFSEFIIHEMLEKFELT